MNRGSGSSSMEAAMLLRYVSTVAQNRENRQTGPFVFFVANIGPLTCLEGEGEAIYLESETSALVATKSFTLVL